MGGARAVLAVVLLLALPVASRAACPARPALNGHRLTPKEARWLRYVAASVLPRVAGYGAGSCGSGHCRDQGCAGTCLATVGTWWALKEGNFDPPGTNPFRQSLCHRRVKACRKLTCPEIETHRKKKAGKQPGAEPLACFKDVVLKGAGDVCASDPCLSSTPWQVGLAAIQVPDFSDADVAAVAAALGTSEDALLLEVADLAKFKPGDPRYDAIVHATGVLRRSWLLRHPAVGFILVERTAGAQCVDGQRSWCYGRGWDQTRWYAPSREEALAVIEGELPTLLDSCRTAATTTTVPPTSTTTLPPATACADIFDCQASEVCCGGQCRPNPYAGMGICSTLYTPSCTLCRSDGSECLCNGIFCDTCEGTAALSGCVDPCG